MDVVTPSLKAGARHLYERPSNCAAGETPRTFIKLHKEPALASDRHLSCRESPKSQTSFRLILHTARPTGLNALPCANAVPEALAGIDRRSFANDPPSS